MDELKITINCDVAKKYEVVGTHTCATCPNNCTGCGYDGCFMSQKQDIETVIIINEQHSLLAQQQELLEKRFDGLHLLKVPTTGWTSKQQGEIIEALIAIDKTINIVFVSPIPSMIKRLSYIEGLHAFKSLDVPSQTPCHVYVMANDSRVKKELPNGKIIFTVAKNGWYLA